MTNKELIRLYEERQGAATMAVWALVIAMVGFTAAVIIDAIADPSGQVAGGWILLLSLTWIVGFFAIFALAGDRADMGHKAEELRKTEYDLAQLYREREEVDSKQS